jgi:1-acyl-sn-glycerol-3-phosphate acyltransferase
MQRAHYALMRWWIDGLFTIARSRLGLEVQLSRPELPDTPLIVLARHAGMGDSLLLVRMLLHLNRRPRIVLQQALQWDPCVDIVGHRVPTVFVPVRPDRRRRSIPAIGALARDMRPYDVVVLFPEGGNFTAARHRRAVDRLRREGAEELALRAERLVHLLPPKAPGARALLLAAPTVPVVVAAHAGLEHLDTVRATLRNLPLQRPVALHWSVVAAGCVPTDEPVLVDWLFSRWEEMDGWVSAVLAGATYPPAEGVQPAVTTTPGAGRRASSGIS